MTHHSPTHKRSRHPRITASGGVDISGGLHIISEASSLWHMDVWMFSIFCMQEMGDVCTKNIKKQCKCRESEVIHGGICRKNLILNFKLWMSHRMVSVQKDEHICIILWHIKSYRKKLCTHQISITVDVFRYSTYQTMWRVISLQDSHIKENTAIFLDHGCWHLWKTHQAYPHFNVVSGKPVMFNLKCFILFEDCHWPRLGINIKMGVRGLTCLQST